LRAAESALAEKTGALEEIERRLAEEKAALSDILAMIHSRNKLAESQRRHEAEMEELNAEKTALEAQVAPLREENIKLRQDLAVLQRQVEATWASERMANAILRERITDVASEVVRVAHALEGLGSPIELIVAGKAGELPAPSDVPALADMNGNGLGAVATNGSLAANGSEESKTALAQRLRSVQLRTSRAASASGS
jgi:hypothetical protein